jgi:hypothetical protein
MDLCLLNDTNVSNFVSDLPLFISSKFQKGKKNGGWSTGQEKKKDASSYINIQRQVIEIIIIIIALRWETRWDMTRYGVWSVFETYAKERVSCCGSQERVIHRRELPCIYLPKNSIAFTISKKLWWFFPSTATIFLFFFANVCNSSNLGY